MAISNRGDGPRVSRSVSIETATPQLGCSRRTISNLIKAGKLETVRTPAGSQRDLVCSLVTTPPPPDAPPPVHASVLAFTLVETMLDLFKTEPGSFELTVGMLRGDRRLAPPP